MAQTRRVAPVDAMSPVRNTSALVADDVDDGLKPSAAAIPR
jgi:hypothetical protein